MTILLPPRFQPTDRQQAPERIGGYSLLTFPLDNLKKDGTASFTIAVEESPAAKNADDEAETSPAASVRGGGHDPNPGNNGSFPISNQAN